MDFVAPDISLAAPELFVMAMASLVLLVDVFLRQEQRHITYNLTQLTLLGAALITLYGYTAEPVIGFHGHYINDPMAVVLKLSVYLIAAAVFLYSREYLRDRNLYKGEYYVLGLFGVLGMMIMISGGSFLSIYLGLELLALSQYALVAFNRDSPTAAEAAMKYFILGALASGMLLYGISMIYGATASLAIHEVAAALAVAPAELDLILVFGLVFLVVGLAFKLGAVPFHMWVPDVYQGAPTSVTLYIGSAPKIAAFALLIRVLAEAMGELHGDWQQMLIILAALSLIIGNLVAIVQTNIKRMLAYSTIAHVGFLLLGVIAGTPEGYAAAMFYTITYALMTTGAFGVILLLSRAGVEADNISDFKGLNERNPWLALMMLLFMMSLAGIPFLVGFYAKLVVLQAAIGAGLVWLAILAVLFAVVGAFYYLRIVKFMYFDPPDAEPLQVPELDTQVAIGANGLLTVLLGLYPTALMALCYAAFL